MENLDLDQQSLIDGENIESLDALLDGGDVIDDRTEDEEFFDWTQAGCPTQEHQQVGSKRDRQMIHLVPSAWFG